MYRYQGYRLKLFYRRGYSTLKVQRPLAWMTTQLEGTVWLRWVSLGFLGSSTL